jgi:AMIN domain
MQFQRNLWLMSLVALLPLPAYSQAVRQAQVQKISISVQNPLQLQIQTSAPVTPQAQIISDPERLVIDIPRAVPGSRLRNFSVNRSEVKQVRVGLFQTVPPVTRIVLDLNAPEWYRIVPTASGFTVSLGAERTDAIDVSSPQQPTIGWVSAKVAPTHAIAQLNPMLVRKTAANSERPINGVRVRFANGQLEIHARNATLSEVLFQIQKQTGAEIAIPAGTEQERVAVDSGPAPASEVLAELLNGSDLNFVAVGSEADPNSLRSVILSRRSGAAGSGTAQYVPSYTPPPTAANFPPDNVDINQPPVDENPPDDSAPPQPSPN